MLRRIARPPDTADKMPKRGAEKQITKDGRDGSDDEEVEQVVSLPDMLDGFLGLGMLQS